MSSSKTQMRHSSLSWLRGKRNNNTDDTQASSVPTGLLSPPDQVSLLLALPYELQQRIFDFIALPWSMAIMYDTEQDDYKHELDSTFALIKAGSKITSGPPGYNLLLTCRAIYQSFYPRYGSHCTGRLFLGHIKGHTRRKVPDHLALKSHLRFNHQIQKISLSFAADFSISVGFSRFGPKLRKLFPNVRRADCVVHEGSYGPLLGDRDVLTSFLSGRYDEIILELTRPAVNYYIGTEGSSFAPLFSTSKPWNDEQGVVDVKVFGTKASWADAIVALNYIWEGSRIRIISRAVRYVDLFRYWEEGMRPLASRVVVLKNNDDDDVIPEKMRWVRAQRKATQFTLPTWAGLT